MRKYRETMQLVVAGHWHKWASFAHSFGLQHYAIAATGYDPNACMSIEIDRDRNTWRSLNESLVKWSTHYSMPYTHV